MKHTHFISPTIALFILLPTLHARNAVSCSCAGGGPVFLPSDDHDDVPSNTRLWLFNAAPCELTLMDSAHNEILMDASQINPFIQVFTPREELLQGETYQASCADAEINEQFTVTEGPDLTAPSAPLIQVGESEYSNSRGGGDCGDQNYSPLTVDHDGDILLLGIGQMDLDEDALSGTVDDVFLPDDFMYVGEPGDCSYENWNFDARGDAENVRVAAFDLAGNLSEWSDPVTVEGCSCTAAGAASSPWSIVLLLVMAIPLLRRRFCSQKSE